MKKNSKVAVLINAMDQSVSTCKWNYESLLLSHKKKYKNLSAVAFRRLNNKKNIKHENLCL